MSDVEDHNKSLGVGHNYLSPCLVKSYITALLFDMSSANEAVWAPGQTISCLNVTVKTHFSSQRVKKMVSKHVKKTTNLHLLHS